MEFDVLKTSLVLRVFIKKPFLFLGKFSVERLSFIETQYYVKKCSPYWKKEITKCWDFLLIIYSMSWNRSKFFFVKAKVFPIISLSCFACVSKMWLYQGAKPWWSGDHSHDQASKRAEYLTLWASSVPCCRDAWGQTAVLKLPSSGSKRKEASQGLLSSLQLCVVGEQSPSPGVLWNCFLCRKGKFLQFSAFSLPCCPGLLKEKSLSLENNE